jgi:SAM-dependent methyltransferase
VTLEGSTEAPAAGASASEFLHLGCGRTIKAGWVNLDRVAGEGVDVVADLDRCGEQPLPFADDRFRLFQATHVLEHLRDPLALMQELHRIAKPGARAVFHVPYGSSDDAWSDPTHVRPYFRESFQAFCQPYYWRADYGYRGDWSVDVVELFVPRKAVEGKSAAEVRYAVEHLRNVVAEMRVELTAVKPIRPPQQDLAGHPTTRITTIPDYPRTSC